MGAPQKDTEAKTPAKAKRKMPTEAERIANLEAQLAAAKEKAAAKNQKRIDALKDKRTKLTDQIGELQSKVRDVNAELKELGDVVDAPAVTLAKTGS